MLAPHTKGNTVDKLLKAIFATLIADMEQAFLKASEAIAKVSTQKAVPPSVKQTTHVAPVSKPKPKPEKAKAEAKSLDYEVALNKAPSEKTECSEKTVRNVLNTMYRGNAESVAKAFKELTETGTFKGTYKTFTKKQ